MLDKKEKQLQKKLKAEFSSQAQEKFWDRFDREYERPALPWNMIVGSFATVCLVVVVGLNLMNRDEFSMELVQYQELLEDYELIVNVDEDLIELTDDEWKILLADT